MFCALGDCAAKQTPHFFRNRIRPLDYAETKSALEFARYIRLNFVSRGYYFYVTGTIPAHKDPARTDAKIVGQYGLDISKWVRARRRRLGIASVQYLRFGREFIILATHGEHRFFKDEVGSIHDIRRSPLRIGDLHLLRWLAWSVPLNCSVTFLG
jgi:hypothetical protein